MATITRTAVSVLADYELHHSGAETTASTSDSSSDSNIQSLRASQPAQWPTQHRRVPPYRPVNRSLDFSQRPAGTNAGEMVFIQVMLHGVWLNSTLSRLWRHTGGRINDRIFYYEIGGEW